MAMALSIGLLGAVSPNIQACYMEFFEKNGGPAVALMGATQFAVAGLISAVSNFLPETLLSITLSQLACSVMCIILLWALATKTPNKPLTVEFSRRAVCANFCPLQLHTVCK